MLNLTKENSMKTKALTLLRNQYPQVAETAEVIINTDMENCREIEKHTELVNVVAEYAVSEPLWVSENASVARTNDGVLHLITWGQQSVDVIATA